MTDSAVSLTHVDLSPAWIQANCQSLLAVAADIPGEYWTKTHFLAELPMKWDLSFVVVNDGLPIAYSVLSRKGDAHSHLHHFMVHRDWRSRSIGPAMLEEIVQRVRTAGLPRLTLKIASENVRGQAFYRRHGFSPVKTASLHHTYEKYC